MNVKYASWFVAGCVFGYLASHFLKNENTESHTALSSSNDAETAIQRAQNELPVTSAQSTVKQSRDNREELSLKELKQAYIELRAENENLKQAQQVKQQRNTSDLSLQYPKLSDNETEEGQSAATEQQITNAKLTSYIPAPFNKMILTGNMSDVHNRIIELHEQEDDYSWGYDMQVNIADFFVTDVDPDLYELVRVTCKYNACEILIKSLNNADVRALFDALRDQEWWNLQSTHSTSSNGENENEMLTFIFAYRYK